MKLYILRHAIAEERDENTYPDDSLRPLTRKGEKKMTQIAQNLAALGIDVELILSSPYVRAFETAKIVAKTLDLKPDRVVQTEHLTPAGLPNELVAEINEKYKVDNLMLVGHEPYLSSLIAVLVAGDPAVSILLKKGGLCRLSVDELVYGRCATLEWLAAPALMA
jgi:phosphohistidine phosphatase